MFYNIFNLKKYTHTYTHIYHFISKYYIRAVNISWRFRDCSRMKNETHYFYAFSMYDYFSFWTAFSLNVIHELLINASANNNLILQLLSKCDAHLNFNENILLKKIILYYIRIMKILMNLNKSLLLFININN